MRACMQAKAYYSKCDIVTVLAPRNVGVNGHCDERGVGGDFDNVRTCPVGKRFMLVKFE